VVGQHRKMGEGCKLFIEDLGVMLRDGVQ
jgi:hypothetical protein